MSWDNPSFMRLLPRQFVLNVATIGRIGRERKAPGTWGSGIGILWYMLAFWKLNAAEFLILFLASNLLSIWFCAAAEEILQQTDPSCVILDEVCAVPLCYFGLEKFIPYVSLWKVILIGFFLFRLFDIWKPLGIRYLQRLPKGIGVVIDDIAAAFVVMILLNFYLFFIK